MGDLLRSNNDKFTIDDLVLQDISSRNLLLKPYKKLQRYQLVPLTLDKIGIVNTEKKDFFNLEEIYHEAELHGYGVIPDIVALHFVNFYSAEILYYGNAQLRSNLAIHPVRCFIPYPIFSGYSKTIWSLSANKKSEKVRLIRSGDAGSIDMSNRQEIERIWWFVQLKKPWTDELRDFLRNE
ncbi:MAG: hypothetical protein K9M36_01180 [Candidatus Pacebacteria bacterium]|nr:hypothetical protein [Candidatus Paceibacterota bacterium]